MRMSTLEGLIFGLLQGITEFLPVSSSAHLKLVKMLFGIESSESQVVFDLICHLGTLVAVLLFFRKDLVQLFTKDRKQLGLLFLATLPLIPCYLLLKPLRDFASAPQYLGICLMITSLILFIGNKWRVQRATTAPSAKKIRDILMIGTMQSAALIPGISRSASTISCARVLGWSPSEAVRFSFLLSIPTIIGGNCLEALKLYVSTEAPIEVSISACIAAFAASCIVGLFMVRFAISILEKGNLKPFAWYCLVLGLVTTLFLCVV
jgi:undecaprenyl-diphosphatase